MEKQVESTVTIVDPGETDPHRTAVPIDVDPGKSSDPAFAPLASPSSRIPGESGPIPGTQTWAKALRYSILALADWFAVSATILVAAQLWAVGVRHQDLSLYAGLWPLLAIFTYGFAKVDLYPGFGLGAVETLRRLWTRTTFIFLILAAASFVSKTADEYSRMTFVIAWAGCLFLLPFVRLLALLALKKARWWGEPVVVIGTGTLARRTIRFLQGALSLGYHAAGVLTTNSEESQEVEGVPCLGGLDSAPALAEQGIRTVLLTTDQDWDQTLLVKELEHMFRHVVLIRSTADLPVEGVVIRNFGGIMGLEFKNELLQRRNRFVKRTMDIVFGGFALLLSFPLIVIGAVLVKILSPGPAFFRQSREGLGGRLIHVVKLRTMHADAEARLEEHLETDPEAREEWNTRFKLKDDPRTIPGIGTFFRRFSIDELPQFWNVLIGQMSLVGPRPFPPYHLEKFSTEFLDLRRRVRSGLTGLWQISIRSDGRIEEQEAYDTYYIRNWSIWMDLYLLGRTIGAVLFRRGAY